MATQRRFRLAYRLSPAHIALRRRRRDAGRARAHRLAVRIRTAIPQLGDEYLTALLDEEFDDLSCEPRLLVQLANQH